MLCDQVAPGEQEGPVEACLATESSWPPLGLLGAISSTSSARWPLPAWCTPFTCSCPHLGPSSPTLTLGETNSQAVYCWAFYELISFMSEQRIHLLLNMICDTWLIFSHMTKFIISFVKTHYSTPCLCYVSSVLFLSNLQILQTLAASSSPNVYLKMRGQILKYFLSQTRGNVKIILYHKKIVLYHKYFLKSKQTKWKLITSMETSTPSGNC